MVGGKVVDMGGKKKTLLVFGPCPYRDNPEITGGIIVLNQKFLEWLEGNNFNYFIVDTNKNNYKNKIAALTSILFHFLLCVRKCDVIFLNGTANDYIFIAPFLSFIKKLAQKKLVLRKFAGNFNEIYKNLSWLKKLSAKYALEHADILFWETKYLVDFGKKFNENSFWFPNVRNRPQMIEGPAFYNHKIVFISHVTKEKGVHLIIKGSAKIDDKITLDVYGPLVSDITQNDFLNSKVNYCGVLKSIDVLQKLADYSILILPSSRTGEGYPGVILEAFSLGIPVIATRIGGIPEILEDGVNGFLLDIGNSDQLAEVINGITDHHYQKMRKAALEKFDVFESGIVHNKIMEIVLGYIEDELQH